MTTKVLTLALVIAVQVSVAGYAALAPLAVVAVPPPSSDLRSRCTSGNEWKRYGSVDTCEDEKRHDELIAFQQARLRATQTGGLASEERTLKSLGFDLKSEPPSAESDETEASITADDAL